MSMAFFRHALSSKPVTRKRHLFCWTPVNPKSLKTITSRISHTHCRKYVSIKYISIQYFSRHIQFNSCTVPLSIFVSKLTVIVTGPGKICCTETEAECGGWTNLRWSSVLTLKQRLCTFINMKFYFKHNSARSTIFSVNYDSL